MRTLNRKFIMIFSGILVALFALLSSSVMVIIRLFSTEYIYDNVYARQQAADTSVKLILDEAAYLYARLVRAENAGVWQDLNNTELSVSGREEAFESLIGGAGMDESKFSAVFVKSSIGVYASNEMRSPKQEDWLKANAATGRFVLLGTEGDNIMIAVNYRNPFSNIIVFYIKEITIREYAGMEVTESGYNFLMTGGGLILSHAEPRYFGMRAIENAAFDPSRAPYHKNVTLSGERYVVVMSEAASVNRHYGFDCYIVNVLDRGILFAGRNRLIIILVAAAAATMTGGVFIALYLARKLTKPINNLNGAINEVIRTGRSAGLKKTADEGDEIFQLEKSYDEMIASIFKLMARQKEDMEKQRKLELDTLQMQINPHFLYNTLDAIAWMAKAKKQPDIERLVISLARFFRVCLHKGDKFIAVRDEMEIIRQFINIELVRFPDKFTVEYNISPEAEDKQTLKLLLQPIVENAVKHGISSMTQMGHITINAYAKDKRIIYEVIDDGVGFDPPEDIITKERDPKRLSGYGLKNVDERIKLEYGSEYGLHIESKIGGGTKVTVVIEARE